MAERIVRLLSVPLRREGPMVLALTLMLALPPALMWLTSGMPMRKLLLSALAQGFVIAWFAVWIPVLTRRPFLKKAIVLLTAILMFAEGLFIIFGEKALSPNTLLLVFETDSREAASFARQFVTGGKIAGAAALAAWLGFLAWLGLRKFPEGKLTVRSRAAAGLLFLAAAGIFAAGCMRLSDIYSGFLTGRLQHFENWTTSTSSLSPDLFRLDEASLGDGFTAMLFSGWGIWLNMRELPRWEKTQLAVLAEDFPRAAEADSVNVIMVIGESFIKRHSPLYGYPLPTTPRMQAAADSGRLVAFTDYISPANLTSASLRNLLNLNSTGDGEPWYKSVYFPLVAKKAGWRVHLYDNQLTAPKYLVDMQLSALMRNRQLSGEIYEWANDSLDTFDGDFIARVEREHPFDRSTGNLDIYHLYGQHFAPGDRYPRGSWADRWTGDSLPYDRPWFTPEKRQTVAEYDNATLYNDSVVASIMARYDGTPAIMIYFSDHGEEMYDAADIAVRNEPSGDLSGWLRRQFEIPLFIWANDRYIALRPDRWQAVKDACGRPGMLDNIGQTVLSLTGATDNRHYNPRRDILSPRYACPPRITVTRSLDFDSITSGD